MKSLAIVFNVSAFVFIPIFIINYVNTIYYYIYIVIKIKKIRIEVINKRRLND